MGKFWNTQEKIFSVFASQNWENEKIKVVPSNFTKIDGNSEFLRVSVIMTGLGINRKSLSGLVIIDIFTKAGFGPKRALELADLVEKYFSSKSFGASKYSVQFSQGVYSEVGLDSENLSLFRSTYSLPFSYNEVL
jgi:hypothetical protein